MDRTVAIILALDKGKGMKSSEPVFMHRICGAALVEWVCGAADSAGIGECVIAAGHGLGLIKEHIGDRIGYVSVEGSHEAGNVLSHVIGCLNRSDGIAVVLYGDMPLISADIMEGAVEHLKVSGCSAVTVTTGEKISVEDQPTISCFYISQFVDVLKDLGADMCELRLSDILAAFADKGYKVGSIKTGDHLELCRICDRVDLARASDVMRKRINEDHMRSGVTMLDPASTHIDHRVEIGADTVIYPGTILEGRTVIGEGCIIGPNSRLVDSIIGNNAGIVNSVIFESNVGDDTRVGPFAYIRPGSSIGKQVKVGDFVEIKNSAIGDMTSISHLTYVGDAEVGKNVNLGCGVVFVNYDGTKKHRTVVEDNVFVGCNVNLVAPVTVRENAFIAAGSTITEEVPANSLAIARSRQLIKEEWVVEKGMQKK